MVDRKDPSSIIKLPIGPAAPRELCTDCGISRSSDPKQCGRACQFIKPDYPALERQVHGRARDPDRADELFFGPFRRMLRASMLRAREGAQWTGIATRLGERLLETGAVDAVLTMAPDPDDRWKPVPVLVTTAEGMAQCRGMRMGYAPLLALLEPARARLQAPRRNRDSLPSVRAPRAGATTQLRPALCRRHALLRQRHHRQLPYISGAARRRSRYDYLSRIPRGLSC